MERDFEMYTLHRLVKEGRLEAVKYWMKKGAVGLYCYGEVTPLILAVQLNNQQIARALLEGLPREESRRLVDMRQAVNLNGPLHIAAASNSLDMVRLLFSYGVENLLLNSADQRARDLVIDGTTRDLFDSVHRMFELAVNDRAKLADFLNSVPAENVAAVVYARNCKVTSLQYFMDLVDAPGIGEIVSFRLEKLKHAVWRAPRPVDGLLQSFIKASSHLGNLYNCLVDNKEATGDLIRTDVTCILKQAIEFLNAYKQLVDRTLSEQPCLTIIDECVELYCGGKLAFTETKRFYALLNEKAPALIGRMLSLCVVTPMMKFMQTVCTAEVLHAAETNDLAKLEKCLVGAPKLKQRDRAGLTPLHHALRHGNNEMAKLLLNFGAADGDGEEDSKETLPHCAMRHMNCSQGVIASGQPQVSIDVVRMILDSRVGDEYVNARRSADGSTALHLAVRANNVCMVQLLLCRGAVYCAEDEAEQRPADLCAEESHKICELLDWCKQLFQMARDGKADELLETAEALDKFTLLAVGGARNVSGITLDRALELKGHAEAAEEMRRLLDSAKGEQ